MESSLGARILERTASEFARVQPEIPTYIHLLVSSLFPIYIGAHASLSRPSSAAKPTKRKRTRTDDPDESSDDEDEEEVHKMEGMSPTDAILMPIMAGITLAGLYFLIKWLEDPALLNKALNAYFAFFGVFSVARLVTDALDNGQAIIFPQRYALDGALYHVHGKAKRASPVAGNIEGKEAINSPLPGFLARLPLSEVFREFLWSDRAMPRNKWTLKLYLHRVIAGKVRIGPHGLTGFVIALAAVLYFNFVGKPWFLTNLMGFGFSYTALQLMSPTTFATGSLILSGLFFYDIYMVFYTPMMVTVAKSLDVPIKLVFPRASTPDTTRAFAMLGLGDVVLPGIMMGLALRFDLFLFYLRMQKQVPGVIADGTTTAQKGEAGKARYHSFAGRWTDHFWTHSFLGSPLFTVSKDSKPEAPFTFPRTYFKASLVGYVLGMLTTLGVMQIWNHAQPALLYLVPGVLGSLWLTALFRGELGLMWEFTEAEEEEEESSEQNGTQASGTSSERTSFFSFSDKKGQEREDRMNKSLSRYVTLDGSDNEEIAGSSNKNKVKDVAGHKSDREVFSFSVEAPWKLKHPRSIRKKPNTDNVHSGSSSPKNGPTEKVPVEKHDEPESTIEEQINPVRERATKKTRLR
ncbi:signal peptide peptidase-domain-containing protein [Dendryphion nanum]|uniref:Signal peptide peptidase-domain-containing protein n=1 Tax=Dendryphion nanum TaxID=256645 RepID=A0A9P9DNX5_9PLEO|nr:signal peptide peptidase-domain-containing protein [Dendryphion nanum]